MVPILRQTHWLHSVLQLKFKSMLFILAKFMQEVLTHVVQFTSSNVSAVDILASLAAALKGQAKFYVFHFIKIHVDSY